MLLQMGKTVEQERREHMIGFKYKQPSDFFLKQTIQENSSVMKRFELELISIIS